MKYIVEHTVGPVLEARFEALAPRLRAAQKLYRQRREHALAKGEDPEKFWNNADMQRLADEAALALRNAAAHDQALARGDAQSARAWALGILQYL